MLANVSFAASAAQLPASVPGVAALSCGRAFALVLVLAGSLTSLPPHAASISAAAAASAMDVCFMRCLLERMTNADHHAGLAGACRGCRAAATGADRVARLRAVGEIRALRIDGGALRQQIGGA